MISVGEQEVVDGHVASTNSDNQLIVHNLTVDLSRSEQVEPSTESGARDRAVVFSELGRHQLVDIVALNSHVVSFRLLLLWLRLRLFLGRRSSRSVPRNLNEHLQLLNVSVSVVDFILLVVIDLVRDVNFNLDRSDPLINLSNLLLQVSHIGIKLCRVAHLSLHRFKIS